MSVPIRIVFIFGADLFLASSAALFLWGVSNLSLVIGDGEHFEGDR